MADEVKLPPTISILSPRPAGILTRNRQNPKGPDPQRAFRCDDTKWATIVDAADLLKMSYPQFIKWVAYMAANEVLRIAREQKVAPPLPEKIEIVEPVKLDIPRPVRQIVNPYK